MKSTMLTFLFAIGAVAFSFGQYPNCNVQVTNSTDNVLYVGIQTAIGSPNVCPMAWASTPIFFLAPGDIITIPLGVAADPINAIRPFRVGCYDVPYTSSSWQVNTCWNPACVTSFEPVYDIQFTSCSDYFTQVEIFE